MAAAAGALVTKPCAPVVHSLQSSGLVFQQCSSLRESRKRTSDGKFSSPQCFFEPAYPVVGHCTENTCNGIVASCDTNTFSTKVDKCFPMGFARQARGPSTSGESSVAIACHGTNTILNTGEDTFRMGDPVYICLEDGHSPKTGTTYYMRTIPGVVPFRITKKHDKGACLYGHACSIAVPGERLVVLLVYASSLD